MYRSLVVSSALLFAVTVTAQVPSQGAATTQPSPNAPVAAPALTADQVIAKSIDAMGGKDAISHVKSVSMETSVQVMGTDAPGTMIISDGVGYKTETDFNGSKIVQCYTPKGGWMVNPMAGSADPTPIPEEQFKVGKEQIHIGGPLVDYASRGSKVELVSSDPGTYKIKLTTQDGVDFTYVFDATTFLVKSLATKGSMQGQEVEMTTSYSDYRKTDSGYLLPYAIGIDFGGQFSLSIAVKKVELNKNVDPAIFAMPSKV